MKNLTDSRLMWLKGIMFLVLGLIAAGLLVYELPSWRVAGLLGLAIWAFCRAYYFAFYVIEHYVDPNYRFAGLGAFVRYLFTRRSCLGK